MTEMRSSVSPGTAEATSRGSAVAKDEVTKRVKAAGSCAAKTEAAAKTVDAATTEGAGAIAPAAGSAPASSGATPAPMRVRRATEAALAPLRGVGTTTTAAETTGGAPTMAHRAATTAGGAASEAATAVAAAVRATTRQARWPGATGRRSCHYGRFLAPARVAGDATATAQAEGAPQVAGVRSAGEETAIP